ncbi:hypothetical protein [Lihuaxuella thermophila]|uniref:Uncharacterized protein n=1 Tax=Lihuaxuella thermophila TaxID=1173111 RepID=A0A1H8FDK4_9BACL|nr:hypothetical protein [Lihuaxuella thermophila]SEN29584.1 hypothetical protein SAMN05444955_108136 [Lihuaxuella thermophila]
MSNEHHPFTFPPTQPEGYPPYIHDLDHYTDDFETDPLTDAAHSSQFFYGYPFFRPFPFFGVPFFRPFFFFGFPLRPFIW